MPISLIKNVQKKQNIFFINFFSDFIFAESDFLTKFSKLTKVIFDRWPISPKKKDRLLVRNPLKSEHRIFDTWETLYKHLLVEKYFWVVSSGSFISSCAWKSKYNGAARWKICIFFSKFWIQEYRATFWALQTCLILFLSKMYIFQVTASLLSCFGHSSK